MSEGTSERRPSLWKSILSGDGLQRQGQWPRARQVLSGLGRGAGRQLGPPWSLPVPALFWGARNGSGVDPVSSNGSGGRKQRLQVVSALFPPGRSAPPRPHLAHGCPHKGGDWKQTNAASKRSLPVHTLGQSVHSPLHLLVSGRFYLIPMV